MTFGVSERKSTCNCLQLSVDIIDSFVINVGIKVAEKYMYDEIKIK